MLSAATSTSRVSNAGMMRGRYDHAGGYRNTMSAAASTQSCRPKWTRAAPIDANGRISRGNHTLVTRLPLPTMDMAPPFRPAEKRLYGSRPDSRKMAKYEIDDGMKYVKTR